jgi:hypothetical protein
VVEVRGQDVDVAAVVLAVVLRPCSIMVSVLM